MVIGLTGGSGTGKTEIARLFKKEGYEVIDYDRLTHEIYTPGSDCLDEIRERFGDEVFLKDGTLDRKALGAIVFSDKTALDSLNSIVYKYLTAYTADRIDNAGNKKLLLDAPTLFEAGLQEKCDKIIGVIAERELRAERICKRDGLSYEAAQNRISSQRSDDFYMEHCDYIIDNSGDLDKLYRMAMTVLRSIDNEAKIQAQE